MTNNNNNNQINDGKNKNEQNWFYSETVKEHFFNPRNIFKTDSEAVEYAKTADGIGMVGSPACGDMMKVWIKVKDDRIAECKWQTFGCASAIASTSVMSVMVTENGGMKLADAMKLKPADIVKKLENLPERKIHCSVLGDQALKAAIKDYEKKKNNQEKNDYS
ncbi:MAG: iron-sulfur cluster assembly scaffold protein [Nanoarchaeota archaeon]